MGIHARIPPHGHTGPKDGGAIVILRTEGSARGFLVSDAYDITCTVAWDNVPSGSSGFGDYTGTIHIDLLRPEVDSDPPVATAEMILLVTSEAAGVGSGKFGVEYSGSGGVHSTFLAKTDWTTGPYRLRFQADAVGVRGKVWLASGSEPGAWDVEQAAVDAYLDATVTGFGVFADKNGGASWTATFDDLVINGLEVDDFNRTVATGLGMTSSGLPWLSANPAIYDDASVDGAEAVFVCDGRDYRYYLGFVATPGKTEVHCTQPGTTGAKARIPLHDHRNPTNGGLLGHRYAQGPNGIRVRIPYHCHTNPTNGGSLAKDYYE